MAHFLQHPWLEARLLSDAPMSEGENSRVQLVDVDENKRTMLVSDGAVIVHCSLTNAAYTYLQEYVRRPYRQHAWRPTSIVTHTTAKGTYLTPPTSRSHSPSLPLSSIPNVNKSTHLLTVLVPVLVSAKG